MNLFSTSTCETSSILMMSEKSMKLEREAEWNALVEGTAKLGVAVIAVNTFIRFSFGSKGYNGGSF